MKIAALMFCLFLSACATAPTQVIVPQEVQVPVPTKCTIKYPEKPEELTKSPMPQGLYDQVVAVLRENVAYRVYISKLEAALGACADPE